jgi:hypothetical protein
MIFGDLRVPGAVSSSATLGVAQGEIRDEHRATALYFAFMRHTIHVGRLRERSRTTAILKSQF